MSIPAWETSVTFVMLAVDDAYVEKLYESYEITIGDAGLYKKAGAASGNIEDMDELTLDWVDFKDKLNMIPDPGTHWGMDPRSIPNPFDPSYVAQPMDWSSADPGFTRPVAYSCGSANNILKTEAGLIGEIDPEYIGEIRFVWSGGASSNWVTITGGTVTASLYDAFIGIFGGKQAYYEAASTLRWEYRVDDEDRDTAGTSTNPFYVTYDDPLSGTTLYHTVVHIGCVAANGVGASEQAVFDAVWGKFAGKEIYKVKYENGTVSDGELLTYYGKTSTSSTVQKMMDVLQDTPGVYTYDQSPSLAREFNVFDTQKLLQYSDGTCGAWQDFAVNVFGSQGIAVSRVSVACTSGYLMVDPTLTGQGGGVPKENRWPNHALISYNSTIYDPSYGISYFGVGDVAKQSFISTLHSIGDITSSAGTSVETAGYDLIYTPRKRGSGLTLADFTFIGWD